METFIAQVLEKSVPGKSQEPMGEIIKQNKKRVVQFSSRLLAEMWNNSELVQIGVFPPKFEADFHDHPEWS